MRFPDCALCCRTTLANNYSRPISSLSYHSKLITPSVECILSFSTKVHDWTLHGTHSRADAWISNPARACVCNSVSICSSVRLAHRVYTQPCTRRANYGIPITQLMSLHPACARDGCRRSRFGIRVRARTRAKGGLKHVNFAIAAGPAASPTFDSQ